MCSILWAWLSRPTYSADIFFIVGGTSHWRISRYFLFLLHTLQIFTPWKLQGLGITGSLQRKPALSMEKGCKNHKETLCMLWINPVIFTDCGKPHDNYRISPKSVNITGFPHNRENLQRPCNICSVENLNNIHISLPEWILLVRVTAILFYVA